jgi:hypothetical protein
VKYVLVFLVLMFIACTKSNAPVESSGYYDLTAHLKRHVRAMFDNKVHLVKYVVYNGKSDQVVNANADWNKEFEALYDADIHNPAATGIYTADTTHTSDSTMRIVYKLKPGNDAAVRTLTVDIDKDNDLVAFTATTETGSWLSTRTQSVTYKRLRSFTVNVTEDNRYTGDNAYSVIGEIHLEQDYFQ